MCHLGCHDTTVVEENHGFRGVDTLWRRIDDRVTVQSGFANRWKRVPGSVCRAGGSGAVGEGNMARILFAMLLVCGWAWGCEGSDDGGKDVPQTVDPGPGGDVATDVPPADDVPVQDPGGGPTDEGGGNARVGSCLAHITTQCVEYHLPAGAPTGEIDQAEVWCTGPKVWADEPCPTEGQLGVCTVPPADGAGYVTTKYVYYSEALLPGGQTTCQGYGNATWSTP